MPAFLRPNCWVRLSGIDYKLRRDGLEIVYMPNGWQLAKCIIDLNEGSAPSPSLFASESAVDVKIENVTMMTGYIVQAPRHCMPLTQRSPGKKLSLELTVADKVGYLTKGEFTNDYFRSKTIQRLMQDVAGTLGVSHSISAFLTGTFSRSFFGTMAKDALAVAVDKGADWFGDEAGILNGFPQANPPALTTGGFTYQIQDFTSGASHQIEVSHLHSYFFDPDNALFRYRNVKVMNSNRETWPLSGLDTMTSALYWNGEKGYHVPRWCVGIQIAFQPNKYRAGKAIVGPAVGGDTNNGKAPAIQFETLDTQDDLFATFIYVGGDDPNTSLQDFNIQMGSYDELWFHIWTDINLANAIEVRVELKDNNTSAAYQRNVKADINGSSTWTFCLYQLPTTTSGSAGTVSNGWTKADNFNFNRIDSIRFAFFNSSTGTLRGWPANSKIAFATVAFVRRMRSIANGAATGLNLTKPIVNDSTQDKAEMLDQASSELARVGYAKLAGCTCPGHTDFKRPGYGIDVNFNQTFGSGHNGFLRMEKIRHYLDGHGLYWMDISLAPARRRL